MGGDATINDLNDLAIYLKNIHPNLKVAWYSGKTLISSELKKEYFDYIKIGPYIEHLGALNKKTTNQRMYKRYGKEWQDITFRFWKK